MKTVEVLGMTLPVIAELPGGFRLVAHKNGPAIADNDGIYALDAKFDEEELPTRIQLEAVRNYIALSWPAVKELFA